MSNHHFTPLWLLVGALLLTSCDQNLTEEVSKIGDFSIIYNDDITLGVHRSNMDVPLNNEGFRVSGSNQRKLYACESYTLKLANEEELLLVNPRAYFVGAATMNTHNGFHPPVYGAYFYINQNSFTREEIIQNTTNNILDINLNITKAPFDGLDTIIQRPYLNATLNAQAADLFWSTLKKDNSFIEKFGPYQDQYIYPQALAPNQSATIIYRETTFLLAMVFLDLQPEFYHYLIGVDGVYQNYMRPFWTNHAYLLQGVMTTSVQVIIA